MRVSVRVRVQSHLAHERRVHLAYPARVVLCVHALHPLALAPLSARAVTPGLTLASEGLGLGLGLMLMLVLGLGRVLCSLT